MRPTLVLNPRHDPAFEAVAGALVDGKVSPAELEAGLRAHYPDAVVRARDLSSESGEVWYVYREGRWIGSGAGA
jgi:hypothetical protein